MNILGIDTSCDDTSAATVQDGRRVLSNIVNSQIGIHYPYGGVVPELASREHVRNIVPVVKEALATAGLIRPALSELLRIWGGMVRHGATTFWECFDPAWSNAADLHGALHTTGASQGYGGHRISLCHGWAAGPAAWLPRWILGVKPLAQGFSEVTIAPRLGDLVEAQGTIPTPHGELTVSATKAGKEISVSAALPPGVTGILPGRRTRLEPGATHTATLEVSE